jgi:6-phosphogluconolactonase (cycloisomerase 2 family)
VIKMRMLYIAACNKEGGIYRFELKNDGSLVKKGFTPMEMPMYMAEKDGRMHIILREPFLDSKESGYLSYDICEDGSLYNPSELVSTGGEVACHILATEEAVFTANYVSGSVSKVGEKVVIHTGKGPHPVRQTSPHTHFVGESPDGEAILVTDLGSDSVYVYDKDLNEKKRFFVPAGEGARHLVFSDNGKFCFVANELGSSVSVFEVKGEEFTLIETLSTLPEDFNDFNLVAAIRLDNDKLYVSNRGHNSIAVFDFSEEKLKREGIYSCGGNFPRDFIIEGDFIICTNERGNSVTVLSKKDMKLLYIEEDIPTPLCALVLE